MNSDDLPLHWEQRHFLNVVPNSLTNYDQMKLERKKEEWTLRGEIEEQFPKVAVVLCGWFMYILCDIYYPEKTKGIREVFMAFINLFVSKRSF